MICGDNEMGVCMWILVVMCQFSFLIVSTERSLPKKHLISQNIANKSATIAAPHPAVSVFNFHYAAPRSEEHTSELQSPCNLVCRLLLEKKNKTRQMGHQDTRTHNLS